MKFACVSVKGGAGKSTVAVNLAAEYLRQKRKVLVVDADPQGTARVWSEVAAEAGRPTPAVVAMGKEMHRKGQLDRIATGFDVVAIDCPGRDGAVVRSALMVADIAVVPCGASPADAWALAQTLDMIEEARTLRPSLQVCVVITRKRETGIGKGAHSDLSAAGVPVSSVVLGERVAYQQAMGEGRGVTSYGLATPAAKEIRALATYIEKLVEKANESTVARVA